MTEIWKEAAGFPQYEVSSYGNVRSKDSQHVRPNPRNKETTQTVTFKGVSLTPTVRLFNGRPSVCFVYLRKNNKTKTIRVHRLVLETFIGPAPDGCEGCHNDGDALNNRLDNLRWDTHRENQKDSMRHGTKKKPPLHIGATHPMRKLSLEDEAEIRNIVPYFHGHKSDIARKYGVSLAHVCRLVKDGPK